jgi:enoyl-CoA hydratase/carnithine racemase
MGPYETIQCVRTAGLGWIYLNRPDKYNAFDETIMAEIADALEVYRTDAETRVVIFKGNGKNFASGADIAELRRMTPADALFPSMQSLYDKIYHYPKPTIAAIHGYTLGGGMELATACDIRIAAENARFGLPECKLGVMPGAGGTHRLVRLLGEAKVKELVLLGDFMNAQEALASGFVTSVVPPDELEHAAAEAGRKIIEKAPLALRLAKMAIQRSQEAPLEVGQLMENTMQAFLFSSADKKEGVAAFLEKRKPNFQGK